MTTSAMIALAMGLPTIATRHSAFPDQIIDGKNGFLVDEGDYRALAEKILYYIDHPELWPGFGRFGREHMYRMYDAKMVTDKQVGIYEDVLKQE